MGEYEAVSGSFVISSLPMNIVIGGTSSNPGLTIKPDGSIVFGDGWAASDVGREVVATIDAIIGSRAAEIARLKAIMLDEDLVWNAIHDCMDYDWSSRDAARAVVRVFQKEIGGE